ncbi:MAG: LPS-assembly protein LptD [Verrucomicrobiales bacterium]|nr:LPS-assembly protein LptD [Verrucomicrobiales bacterium]
MHRVLALTAALLCLVAPGLCAAEMPATPDPAPREQIQVESLNPDFLSEYDPATGLITASHGVRVVFRDTTLTAERVQLNEATGDTLAEGGVNLVRGAQTWAGTRLQYNFRTDSMGAEDFRLGVPPLFVGGEKAITLEPIGTNRVYSLTNSFVTTDDLASPGYRIRARTLIVREDRRLIAKDAVLVLGETPVFWFPYYTRRLGDHKARWILTPGYRSLYGAYLRAAYEFEIGTNTVAAVHIDPYSKRGIGLGPSVAYDLGPGGHGEFHGYWIADQNPEEDPVTGQEIDPQRERISFSHQVTLRPDLTGTAVVRQQSDATVIREFFEDEFRQNPLPGSHVELQQAWPDFTLNTLARFQVNEFFETVERLPDVRLSAHRQELGQSGIYYEGENSVGWYQHRYATDGPTNDYSAFRADTFHQLLLPKTFFGWLNVTPRAGGRLTYYGDTDSSGWDSLEAETRGVFNTGAEVSFKAHRLWSGTKSKFWDADGLRHIVEPSVNYAFTPEPNARPLELPQFDTELPSLRPLPVTYPDYNSIDSVDSQNVMRLGMRNKLQTKRDGQVEDLLDWAVITDWRLDPRENQGRFSDIYSEADFKPRRWLTLNSEMRVDPQAALLRESHSSAIFKPGRDWSFAVTHRYTRDDPVLGRGGDLLGTRLYLRFSENWGFRTSHYFEIREEQLQEQYYTVYRDLRSLTAALTLRFRETRQGEDDFTIAVSISLKAFPRFKTGQDAERPLLLIGG